MRQKQGIFARVCKCYNNEETSNSGDYLDNGDDNVEVSNENPTTTANEFSICDINLRRRRLRYGPEERPASRARHRQAQMQQFSLSLTSLRVATLWENRPGGVARHQGDPSTIRSVFSRRLHKRKWYIGVFSCSISGAGTFSFREVIFPGFPDFSGRKIKRYIPNDKKIMPEFKIWKPPIEHYVKCVTDELRDKCSELILTDEQIKEYMKRLLEDIKRGLGKDTHASAIVKSFVTYVQDLPDGTETGRFLALDLGGTNFRVLLIELSDQHFEMKSKIFAIPQHIMLGSGEQLFDHIADCLAIFIKEEKVQHETLPLGFTFSFPLNQLGLTRGILETWTKGFKCSGVVGNDVVLMLKDAITRRGDIKIEVFAILNDTTGTLMSCAWKNHNTKIGIIVGTGNNGCYVEKQKNAELFNDVDNGSGNVIINLEWGAFGDDGRLDYLRAEYDRIVDEHSLNPGKQIHEKMISGMYMGELVRLAIVRFTKEGILFGGKGSELLFTRGRFYTKYVSEIESDPPGSYENCQEILEELHIKHATEQDFVNVRFICECISRRAAHLVSAGIATLLNKMDDPDVTIGVDGSVYRYHPHFHNLMMEKIRQLTKPHIKFDIMLSEDGSGRGAALVAAVASKNAKR